MNSKCDIRDINDIHVKRNYKDTVFRMVFSKPEDLLSLYNAVNGTSYQTCIKDQKATWIMMFSI